MFYALGEQPILDMIAGRSDVATGDPGLSEPEYLRRWSASYKRWLGRIQPIVGSREDGPVFVLDPALRERLLKHFPYDAVLNDLPHYRDPRFFEDPDNEAEMVAETNFLRERHDCFVAMNPEFWALFDLLVNYVVCVKSSVKTMGGTISNCIGVIFACSPSAHEDLDVYEFFVHEFTHTSVFVYERTTPVFCDIGLLADPRNWYLGVMSQKERPLDKAFHSAVVCTELLLHREHSIGHEAESARIPSSELLPRTCAAIDRMIHDPRSGLLLNPSGFDLLAGCRSRLSNLRLDRRTSRVPTGQTRIGSDSGIDRARQTSTRSRRMTSSSSANTSKS